MSNLSYIHPSAKIGSNVTIEPFAYIGNGVVIGDNCWIGPNATILEGARIGKNCKIFPNAVVSAIPQDLKFKGEMTTVEIGDNTTIRECATVNRGTAENQKTVIGRNCLIMAYCHVAHDCVIGNNCVLANCVNLAGHVRMEDFVICEGLVAVQQFIRIGAHSFIAGGSLVRKNVPPYVKAAREPLSYVGVNSVGMKRRGFAQESIKVIEDIYRVLFVKGYGLSTALQIVEEEMPVTSEKEAILSFVRNSQNGIMKGLATNGSVG